jgi:hypothetical protein
MSVVETIMIDLYLKQGSPFLMQMFETARAR